MTQNVRILEVTEAGAGQRLDGFIAEAMGISRGQARRLLDAGLVRIAKDHPGAVSTKGKKGGFTISGMRIEITETTEAQGACPVATPEAPLDVIAEGEHWVAVNKPNGCPSHPLRPGERGTLANALVARYPECSKASPDGREGGLVHRLDTATTGVLVAARNADMWQRLRDCFSEHRITKRYLALVFGKPHTESGRVTVPLRSQGRRAIVDAGGLAAETGWRTVEHLAAANVTLLEIEAQTGRMHQVRSHMAYLGLPLVGDVLYGAPALPAESNMSGHVLHASALTITAPDADMPSHLEAPVPAVLTTLIESLRAGQLALASD